MKKEICKDGSIIYRCNGYDEDNKKYFVDTDTEEIIKLY